MLSQATDKTTGTSRPRAVAYIRVSTTEQAEHGYSIDAQQQSIAKYCAKENFTLVKSYIDRGVSGKSINKRYQLQQLLKDAKQDQFDMVIVWKISRMARNLVDLMSFVKLLESQNVWFRSISEDFKIDTATGKMMLQIMASFNEYERDNIAENVKLGLNRRAREGYTNGNRILGYDNEPNAEGRAGLVINPEESKIVTRIFDLYQQGFGFRSIANTLNHNGLKTKRGNTFSTIAVKDILMNPTYTGLVRYNRYEQWDKKRRKGLNPNPIICEGKHKPIISRSDWDSVQRLLQLNSHQPKWSNQGANVLTGLLRCPECGGPMAASNTTNYLRDGTKKRIRYYSCANFRNKGSKVCHANSIRADVAETLVAQKLQLVLENPDISQRVIKKMDQYENEYMTNIDAMINEKERQISTVAAKLKKLQALAQQEPDMLGTLKPSIENHEIELLTLGNDITMMKSKKVASRPLVNKRNLNWLLNLVAAVCRGKDKRIIKRLYHLFINKVTFDRDKKLVYVHMKFTPDVINKLKMNNPKDDVHDKASSFSSLIEFTL